PALTSSIVRPAFGNASGTLFIEIIHHPTLNPELIAACVVRLTGRGWSCFGFIASIFVALLVASALATRHHKSKPETAQQVRTRSKMTSTVFHRGILSTLPIDHSFLFLMQA